MKASMMAILTALIMLASVVAMPAVVFAAFVPDTPAKYATDFATFDEEKEAAELFNIELAKESFVLLKNTNNALPLNETEKYVSLFGTRSDNLILGGGGSGGGTASEPATVRQSLEAEGFKLNPKLISIYDKINDQAEPGIEVLAPAISSYPMYDDAAIIIISRTGSEFFDAPLWGVDGHSNKLDHTYMLDDNEKVLIDHVATHFDKVVVVINSAHPMDLDFVEDHDGVDAVLWMGHPGKSGAMALGPILSGKVNPSGRTADIYPVDFTKDPTWPNFKGNIQSQLQVGSDGELYIGDPEDGVKAPRDVAGGFGSSLTNEYLAYSAVTDMDGNPIIVDGPSGGANYYATLDYEEGIYMGYRWYETAAVEGFFDDYIDQVPEAYAGDAYYNRYNGVVYPFGYGLSYTTFDWEIINKEELEGELDTSYGAELTLKVAVTNTGAYAGKDVVQVYYTAPYYPGEIEKSHVTLVEFAKTKLLQPGEKQILTITFKVQDMASFDYNDANNNGHAGYELDPGQYEIGVYANSHTKKDSFFVEISGTEPVNYDKHAITGNDIHVLFTGDTTWDGTRSDLTYYDSRRTEFVSPESPMTYMSRADFEGTFPEAPTPADLKWSDEAIKILHSQVFYTSFNDLPTDPWYKDADDIPDNWTQGEGERIDGKTPIQLWEMSGVDYDDPLWDEFMNQLTWQEMVGLISSNSFRTPALDSIGKPASNDRDGPAQIAGGTFWVCEVNIASTWNTELAYKQGRFVGNESLFAGTQGWYGPGLNIHRNPTAGRNFEYYSQDGFHSGKIAAAVIKGATDLGVTTYMKHLFLNDQETSRYTVSTFVTEQALREIYAKPWEMAIIEGNATASMSAFNKVGLLSTTSHYNLYVRLMQEEWGFKYSTVTDMFGWAYSPGTTGDMSARMCITPLGSWNNTFGRNIEGQWDEENNVVVVTFTEKITNGSRWNRDENGVPIKNAQGNYTSTAMNASNPGNINEINEGASAAYKDATTMLDGTELYKEGDILQSYTQWYAVRKAAKHLLFAQVNSNTMRNGIDLSDITGTTLDSGRQGQSYNANIAQAGLQNAVYSLTAGSALPEGLSLSDTGRISGTPTEAGTFNFTVEIVVDGYIKTTANYALTIDSIFNLEDIDGIGVGGDVNGKIASDEIIVGVTTYPVRVGWSNINVPVTLIEHNIVSGRLPAGLSLDSDGSITGVPTAQGSYSFVVETRVLAETTHPQQGYIFLEYFYKTPLTIEVGAPVPTFTVTFDSNFEGSTPVVAVVREGEKATPLAPYRAGYVFTGWYADEDCTIEMDFSQAITEDITVYAGWKSLSEMDDAQKSITDDIDDIISGIDDLNEDIKDLNTVIDDLNAQLDDSNDKLSVAKTIGIVGTIIGTIGLLSAIAAVILNILKKKRI